MKNFFFSDSISAIAHHQMNNETVKKMWHGFCFGQGSLDIRPSDEFVFVIGQPKMPVLPPEKEFIIHIDEDGAAVIARDYSTLVRGFLVMLMKIECADDGRIFMPCMTCKSNYSIKNRMIHVCVFPENDLYFIKKLIRLSAVCQYTHIVIEFWGMLKYDCLKELSWPHGFTKAQAKELIDECRDLGLVPIPMFNHLGHATASRLILGKHVVLDQNPRLQRLFTPDGWAWNIQSDEVFALLKSIRTELYELFGKGEYMHLGCDEAYYISRNAELRGLLPSFLNKLTTAVENEGCRPMIWMDMLLEKDKFPKCYCCGGEPDECENLRQSTAKSTVFVDWQYDAKEAPVLSLESLKDCGHDVMGAPWYNYKPHIDTINKNNLFGLMLTTWHFLNNNLPHIYSCAKAFGAEDFNWSASSGMHEKTATIMRRISFEGNTYADCGWSKEQIHLTGTY